MAISVSFEYSPCNYIQHKVNWKTVFLIQLECLCNYVLLIHGANIKKAICSNTVLILWQKYSAKKKIYVNNVIWGKFSFGLTYKVCNLPKGKDASLNFLMYKYAFQLKCYQVNNPNRCPLEIQML